MNAPLPKNAPAPDATAEALVLPDSEQIITVVPTGLAALMREAVAAGEYHTEGEIVREALAEWRRDRDNRRAVIADLRRSIEQSASEPGIPAEEVYGELTALIEEHIVRPR